MNADLWSKLQCNRSGALGSYRSVFCVTHKTYAEQHRDSGSVAVACSLSETNANWEQRSVPTNAHALRIPSASPDGEETSVNRHKIGSRDRDGEGKSEAGQRTRINRHKIINAPKRKGERFLVCLLRSQVSSLRKVEIKK